MTLPPSVRSAFLHLSPAQQKAFRSEFRRLRKGLPLALLLWISLGLHYLYLGKPGTQFFFWITGGGLLIWWLLDLPRLPGMISRHNAEKARQLMQSHQILNAPPQIPPPLPQ